MDIPRPTMREADDNGRVLVARLQDLVSDGCSEILVNLADVPYADSVLLGAIAHAFATARRQGVAIKLLRPTSSFRELLHVTKLDHVLEIVESEKDDSTPS